MPRDRTQSIIENSCILCGTDKGPLADSAYALCLPCVVNRGIKAISIAKTLRRRIQQGRVPRWKGSSS